MLKKTFPYFAIIVFLACALAPAQVYPAQAAGPGVQPPTFEVKEIDGLYLPFQNGIPFPSWERQDRPYIELDGSWRSERQGVDHKLTLYKRTPETLKLLEEESTGRYKADYDDSAWKEKSVPGVEDPAPDRYMDGAWYRRHFTVPADASGKYVKLMFEAANYFTDVWINGKWIGCHEGGYTPFAFDISQYLNYGQDNVIAVRVDNIPWLPNGDASSEALSTNDHNIVPYVTGDWWNYGGITRSVYIEISPPVSVVRADIKPKLVNEKDSELTIDVTVYNRSDAEFDSSLALKIVQANVKDDNLEEASVKKIATGRTVSMEGETSKQVTLKAGEAKAFRFSLKSGALKPWSPESPNLYVLRVALADRKARSGELYTQFGVREASVDKANAKLLLNGKEIFLRGIARHEVFYGEPGPLVYGPAAVTADFKYIKDANANFVRTAHYPNQQQTYTIADRMGLLVWEEIPMFWFTGPEFLVQKNVRGIGRQMWFEMIYRDYNRPSVIIWGACNECSWQGERAVFIKDLRENAYKVDGTRLVAQSASGSDPTDATQKECDIIGFTTYYGIFYGSSYFADTKEALKKTHQAFPDKPVISTEYGVWARYGDLAQEASQVEVAKDTFKAFRDFPFVAGATWWTIADWHTMINEPEVMGTMTIDRKFQKPVYFQLQRQYASLLGDLAVELKEPKEEAVLQGKAGISAEIKGEEKPEAVELIVEGKLLGRLYQKKDLYRMELDTSKLPEGKHMLIVRATGEVLSEAKGKKGYYVSDFVRVIVDNIDELPAVTVNLKDNDAVIGKVSLKAVAADDRGIASVTYSVDGEESKQMEGIGEGNYQAVWDASQLPDGSTHDIKFIVTDTGSQTSEATAKVTIDNKPGKYAELPLDHDWISWNTNRNDGTGYDFPAEELPDSNSEFIFNGAEKVKFKFGDKADGQKNTVECGKQKIAFPPGYYTKVHILAAMHDGGSKQTFVLSYTDGTSAKVVTGFSDWWGGNPIYGEEVAVVTTYHHESAGDRKPGVALYMQTLEPDKSKILSSLTLPADKRLNIFAITLEGEVSNIPLPEPAIIEPGPNSSVGGAVKIAAEDKQENIAKIDYSVDGGEWMPMSPSAAGTYTAEWDTSKVPGINHMISVKATDKIGQINIKSIDVRVVNKVTIVFPFDGASIYKMATLMVEPRANTEVDKLEYSIDNGRFIEMSPNMGLYTAEWRIDEGYKPGSIHTLMVRENEKSGAVTIDTVKITADTVKIMIAEPVKGHTIKVDKNIRDWVGTAPAQENTATISGGEYIWEDAKGDGTGNGHYTYPTNKALTKGADLREFRVTWDKENLYLMIKCDRPGDFWTPYRIIGIDQDGAKGGKGGTQVLAQGDGDQDTGCYGNLKVSPDLACEYVIGIFNSYKGRIWDAKGKTIARKEGDSNDTPGFMVDDANWNSVEVAIPLKLIGGSPAGHTWRFVVGTGQQDSGIFRKVDKDVSEWHGGGGEVNGSNPYIYDMASPDRKTQEYELNSYKKDGDSSDPLTFAVINRSYLAVTFSDEAKSP
ncbi:MAG: glycoside hydrolase family 2 TIM barrel-domain containing protein [Candidatus Omnitrophica bacterium]|nr:glycoside hydrolase family 2 TIM barrel-domain containing protein [Candidatus Omnitrophota bacterium]MDD5310969.1 glycoside hydrolase family 2 TIM barrel-domain containing protein [Candidatus Omnitrophota bacterium]